VLTPGSAVDHGPSVRRVRLLVVALPPTARVARVASAGLTVAVAAVPTIVAVLSGATRIALPFVAACVIGGAALGWATEDPAAELLAAMPMSSATRTMLRMLCVALVCTFGVAVTGLIVAVGPGLPPPRWDRVPEVMAAVAVALAVGLAATRRGERDIGPVAVTAGVLSVGFIAALASRWPAVLPTFLATPNHTRWWILAALAIIVAARAGRDPGRR
jgi:hypothetical protein